MHVNIDRNSNIFLYDVKTSGYDTNIWNTISGTPTVATGKLKLNTAEINSFAAFTKCSVEFLMTIPTAPTSGDSRSWGLKVYNYGNKGRIEFNITDTNFTAKVYDDSGTLIDSIPITWDSNWTNIEARFRITFSERNVFFSINDVIVARFQEVDVTENPLALHIINSVADDLLFAAVSAF
jgi:hypothetical protein